MKTLRKVRSAFTLVEMIVAIGIALAIFTAVSALFVRANKTFTTETAKSQLQLNSRSALLRMGQEIRQANTVAATYSTYTTSSSVLILQLPSIDSSENILPLTYDYVIYQAEPSDSTKLQEITIADPSSTRKSVTRTIAHSLSSITFKYYDTTGTQITSSLANAKLVKPSLTLQETHNRLPISTNNVETITLRNK